ncbi:hypothetical protein MN608_08666 [Microdochium nivale]|nr:hypothetical protein MN608_08666 [Microdochium nivale]
MPSTRFTNTAEDPSITFELPTGPMTIYLHGNAPQLSPLAGLGSRNVVEQRQQSQQSQQQQALSGAAPAEVAANVIPPGSHWAAAPHWHELHTEHFIVAKGFALVRVRGEHVIVGSADEENEEEGNYEEGGAEGGVVNNNNNADHWRTSKSSKRPVAAVLDIPPYTIHGFSRADVPGPVADQAWAKYYEARRGQQGSMSRKGGGARNVRHGAWTQRDVVLFEWTTPSDGAKEVFFRNTMSYFRDHLQPLLTELIKPHHSPCSPSSVAQHQQDSRKQKGQNGVLGRWSHAVAAAVKIAVQVPRLVFQMAHMDNHMLLLDNGLGVNKDGGVSRLSLGISHGMYGAAKRVGGLLGWRHWWEEYTPERLRETAERL